MPIVALGSLAGRHLRSRAARSALTALGVACGVALVVAVRVINVSTLASFRAAIEDLAGESALQVRGAGPFPEAVVDSLRALAGVGRAVPVVTTTFFAVDPPAAGEALSVFAADVTDPHAVRTLRLVEGGDRVVDDPLGFLVDPRSVVLTEAFAARAGIRAGERIRLRTPHGIETFPVQGLLPAGGVGRAFGGNLLLMDVVGAQVVLGRGTLVDQVDLTLAPDAQLETVEAAVRAALPPPLEVLRPGSRGEQIERYLDAFQALLSGLSGLALLAAMFLIASAVATEVAARRREIGLLRAVGARRRDVIGLFVGGAIGVGVVGVVLGLPGGVLLASLLRESFAASTELVFSIRVLRSDLHVAPATLALGAAAGCLAAAGAGWLPARAAARVPPLAALGLATPLMRPRGWLVAATAGMALALAGAALWAEVWLDSPWSGNVAAFAADVALVCIVMGLAGPAARVLLGPWRRVGGVPAALAAGRLARMPDQLALAAGVLALGLGLMILSATLARSFEESVLGFIRRQVRADLVVASTATTGWIEAPVPERIGEALGALPGVASVERLRLAEHDHEGVRISIDSLDASAFAPGRERSFTFAAGDPVRALAAVRTESAVLVSRNLARRKRLAVGDTLALQTPGGQLTAPIAGVVVDYVSPRGSVILTRGLYQRWWLDTLVNRFHLTLRPGADVVAVRRAIATGVGSAEGLKALTQRALYDYHRDAVRRAFQLTRTLEILPLLVAGLGLAQALLATGLDRRRELALLRAAGATRQQVARSVVAEAMGVGIVGLAGSLLVGTVLSLLWVRVNLAHQLGWEIDLHLAPWSLGAAAIAAIVVSVAAGAWPARRIARLPVGEALRGG